MSHKDVVFKEDARASIIKGIEKLAKAVKTTLGPSGRNVAIARKKGSPLITKDGVTVAKSIQLQDELEKLGAAMVQEVASKTNEKAGDGTTTATILAEAIFKEGVKLIGSGFNAIMLKRQMDDMTKEVVNKLKELAKPVVTDLDVENIATISTNNDPDLGNIIAQAINKVGEHGSVLVENSPTELTTLKYVDGMQLERSYLSTAFITNFSKQTVEYDNPKYLIIEDNLDTLRDIAPILEHCIKENVPLIIAADEVEDNILMNLIVNRVKGGLKIAVIQTPGFGEQKHEMISDFAKRVDANIFNKDLCPLRNFKPEDLGTSKKIVINMHETVIVDGSGDITERVSELKASIESIENALVKNRIQQRINYITNGIAIIQLGAMSETELKEKKLRVEDALNATRAAIAEGIVPGGGIALLRVKKILEKEVGEGTFILTAGGQVILNVLESPIRAILDNTGFSTEKILVSIELIDEQDYGYNAANGVFGNMFEMGIIDPVKVTRCGIQNATSVAGMLLTTDVAIIEGSNNE